MSLLFFDIAFIKNFMSAFSGAVPESFALIVVTAIAMVIINACLLTIFGLVGTVFLKRMQVASGDIEQQKRKVYEDAEALLEKARKESLRIIGEADKKASELLQQTQAVKGTLETQLTHVLEEFSQKETERVGRVAQDLITSYRTMIESSKQQYDNMVEAVIKEMASDAQRSIKQFEESLKDQTMRYEGVVKQQAQDGFISAQKEITDYKRESLRHVEDAIYHILDLVAKSVFGKALNLEDQQDLVIRALHEAKQQGFFEV
jgi:F0F1-type ATP synthase membrane subunit b/b'